MTDEDKPNKSTIMKGAAVSGIGTILPYAVLAGAGFYLYKKYGKDAEDAFEGVTGAAGGITETINSITETVNNTTKSVTTFIEDNTISKDEATDIEQEGAAFAAGSAAGEKLPKLTGEQEKFISKYSDDKKKVRNFRESPYLNLGLGGETSPQKRSMLGLDDKTIDKAMGYRSKKVQSAQQAQGLSPLAAKGAKPDIRTPDQKKEDKKNNDKSKKSSNGGTGKAKILSKKNLKTAKKQDKKEPVRHFNKGAYK